MNQDFIPFFKDKTVTLMGLGLLGRGVGDARFLARHCKKLYVTDVKSADELRVSVEALREFSNIEFYLGGHDEKIFQAIDFVIKGAGVRLDDPYIAHARAHHVPVYMSTALFARLSPLPIIGITGTRGKTTTTCMIAAILQRAGKRVLRGGNLRGISTLAFLDSDEAYDVAVLELDSWQLQGFEDLKISPQVSVFTNFFPDHMNYYDGNMERYLFDKTAIFRHHHAQDILVTTAEIAALAKPASCVIAPPLPDSVILQIPGGHNRANAALARAAAQAYGIDDAPIVDALQNFHGVEGRLSSVGAVKGVAFYNDSNATTQEATLAALTAFPPQSIVLIFGGNDKGLPIDALTGFIARHKIRAVLIKGTGSDRVLAALPDLTVVDSMAKAVTAAYALAQAGDHIILSPAFTSFGVFKNEYDRSDQFMREVRLLTESAS